MASVQERVPGKTKTVIIQEYPEKDSFITSKIESHKRKRSLESDKLEINQEDYLESLEFIKSLPPLPEEQTNRPLLLPKKTRSSPRITLVLDLDETLVHCNTLNTINPHIQFPVTFNEVEYSVSGQVRPNCLSFLKKCSTKFEVVLFTASQKAYADKLATILDPGRNFIKFRLFRDACTLVNGNFIKNLSILGRDLKTTVIVDNSPQAFGYQMENGIPIKSWYGDEDDKELDKVFEFLEKLDMVDDVRYNIDLL
jgi:CTD small phosphatase-like protein 2